MTDGDGDGDSRGDGKDFLSSSCEMVCLGIGLGGFSSYIDTGTKSGK